jgi:hypothetical protein
VFGGMIAATSLGVFLVPLLYVLFQRMRSLRERRRRKPRSQWRGAAYAGSGVE